VASACIAVKSTFEVDAIHAKVHVKMMLRQTFVDSNTRMQS